LASAVPGFVRDEHADNSFLLFKILILYKPANPLPLRQILNAKGWHIEQCSLNVLVTHMLLLLRILLFGNLKLEKIIKRKHLIILGSKSTENRNLYYSNQHAEKDFMKVK